MPGGPRRVRRRSVVFGNATVFRATLVSLIVGALLACAAELLADVIERSVGGRVRTSEPSAVTA